MAGGWGTGVCVGRSLSRQKQCGVKVVGKVGSFSAAVCKLHANETIFLQVQRNSVLSPVGPASCPHSEQEPREAGWAGRPPLCFPEELALCPAWDLAPALRDSGGLEHVA